MPTVEIKLQPGIDVESSMVASENQWNSSQLIRFREGLPEKRGGWQHINQNQLIGVGRGIHAWADLAGNPYVAVGTDQRLEIFSGGLFSDITPLRATSNITPEFTTVLGSKNVNVNDTANGVAVGDWVNITVPVAIGGVIIQGFYQVQSVVDANDYVIALAAAAVSSAGPGGAVPSFTTVMGSPNITVHLTAHGLTAGSTFQIQVATTVGGITMAAGNVYSVISTAGANNFVIAPGPVASSAATVFENSGNAQIEYLVASGLASATATGGYGAGDYGGGDYGGSGSDTGVLPLRQWFLDNWGADLIGNFNGSPIYVWVPPLEFGNVALEVNTTNFPSATDPPVAVNESFVALPQRQMIALGCTPVGGGDQDPNLVRFSDVDDFTAWTPTAINQAGSYRLPSGSQIVGGTSGNNFCYLWTDVDMWLMSYLGFPLVWGFTKIASGCGLIASRAMGVYKSNVYWATRNQFMVFDGSTAQILDCPVWDYFFYNLDTQQADKINCAVNSEFGEIEWYFPSLTGNGECDSYVTYSSFESQRAGAPIWYYGKLDRTCWTDVNVYGPPLATDTNGNLQQHEVGFDADGVPMLPSISSGYMTIAEGQYFTTVKRLIPDMTFSGGTPPFNNISITLSFIDYPTDTPTNYGPYSWTPDGPPYLITLCRGRMMSITISSENLGVFWRLGGFRYEAAQAGRR